MKINVQFHKMTSYSCTNEMFSHTSFECDSTRHPRQIFPTSLIGEVTYEIAKDDWDETEI